MTATLYSPRASAQTHLQSEPVLRLENVGDPKELAAFAVSLEPSGGAPTPDAPSGPVVMVGKVSG